MQRKSPALAAVLSFFFGPLGYLYIGWRYAILAIGVFVVFVLAITIIDFPIPTFMKYVILVVLAWKAFTFVSVRNKLIDAQSEEVGTLNTFAFAAMAMSDLLVGIAMAYAAAIGLYVTVRLILEGRVLSGIGVLFIGTPMLVFIASLVFGWIAMGIDAICAAKMKNVFRN